MSDKQSMSLKEAKEKFKTVVAAIPNKDKLKFIQFAFEQLASLEDYEHDDDGK